MVWVKISCFVQVMGLLSQCRGSDIQHLVSVQE